jgi:hypothetical protein
MTGFLSALGGFAKGLDQSLQRNEAYAQQAKAAKEKREADFLDAAALKRMDYKNARQVALQDDSLAMPGFPFRIRDPKEFEKDPSMYSRTVVKQMDTILSQFPVEQQQLILDNPMLKAAFQGHAARSMEYKIQKGAHGVLVGRSRWSAHTLESEALRNKFTALGYELSPRSVSINPDTKQVEVTINALTSDPASPEYTKAQKLVNRKHGDGAWEKWVEVHRANDLGEVVLPLDTRIYKAAAGTSVLNSSGPSMNRALTTQMNDADKLFVMDSPKLFKYFNDKNYLSQVFTQFMRSDIGTREKEDLAKYMMEIANDGDRKGQNVPPEKRDFSYHQDQLITLADAISYASGTMIVVRDGELIYENYIPEKRLDSAYLRELQTSYMQAQSLNEQFDDIQETLLAIEEGGLPGSHFPLSLSRTFTTVLGSSGEQGGEGITGIVKGVINVVKNLVSNQESIIADNRANGFSRTSPEGKFAFSDATLQDLDKQRQLVEFRADDAGQILVDYENLMLYQRQNGGTAASVYFAKLKDDQKLKIRQFYLVAAKTELTYKLAMAWQGGAGGRMVSDQDFKVIKNAIWGLPSGKAQAAALGLIRMSTLRPMLRSQILVRYDQPGRNTFKILESVEPVLQAAYDNAYKNYEIELARENITTKQLEDTYNQVIDNRQPLKGGPARPALEVPDFAETEF